jgi:8-oxo-dGTP diphosphatase
VGELRLVGVYSDPARDPRGHTVSVVYTTRLSQPVHPKPGSDAETAEWVENWREARLAFDHTRIIADAEALDLSLRLGG